MFNGYLLLFTATITPSISSLDGIKSGALGEKVKLVKLDNKCPNSAPLRT